MNQLTLLVMVVGMFGCGSKDEKASASGDDKGAYTFIGSCDRREKEQMCVDGYSKDVKQAGPAWMKENCGGYGGKMIAADGKCSTTDAAVRCTRAGNDLGKEQMVLYKEMKPEMVDLLCKAPEWEKKPI